MNKDNGQIIQEDSHEPSHYAMIPKMAMLDLDPYELTLYCHYKMTASEHGKCWKSNKTLASETGMSVRQVQESRGKLAEKGFITLTYTPDDSGNINTPPMITIVNVWSENRSRYAKNDAPPMHSVHTPPAHDAPPYALSASKEYLLNNHQDKKEPRKRVLSYPDTYAKWQWKHIEQYASEHITIDTLACCDDAPKVKNLPTLAVARDCVELFEDLNRNGVVPHQYMSLMKAALADGSTAKYSVFRRMIYALPNWLKSAKTMVKPAEDKPKPAHELSSYELQKMQHEGADFEWQ